MKRKIFITLLTFILALCAIGLTACSVKDNNSGGETPPAVQSPDGDDDGGDNNGGDDNSGDNNGDDDNGGDNSGDDDNSGDNNGSDDNGGDNNGGDDNSATEYVSTAGLEYTLSADETYYICSGIGTATSTDIVIGSKYNDLPVTSIGEEAFYECSSLESVTIGNGVTSIGSGAFVGCSSLKSVTIGNSITSIGYSAFEACDSLTKVNYLGSIDSWAMINFETSKWGANTWSTSNLYINDVLVTEANITTATYISDYAFCNFDNLTSVTIGDSVTSIGYSACGGCSSLTSVTICDSVTSIG